MAKERIEFKSIHIPYDTVVFARYLEEMNRLYFLQRAPGLPREMIEGNAADYNRATAQASVDHFRKRIGQ